MGTTLQTIIEIAIRYGHATVPGPLTLINPYSAPVATVTMCSCDNCRMQARIIETELAEAIRTFAWENPTKPY